MKRHISRREFGARLGATLLLGGGVANAAVQTTGRVTASEVVERIKKKLVLEGIAWAGGAVDTFKIGDPGTAVTGIVSTFQATFDVLERAAAAKKNFIISHERLFWDFIDEVGTLKQDAPYEVAGSLEKDPIFVAKRRFCEDHGLVVWRFHDHWHMHQPDPIFAGLAKKLEWEKYFAPDGPTSYDIAYKLPSISLRNLARHIQQKMGTRDVRVIGAPDTIVSHVGVTAHNLREMHPVLLRTDVVVVGETEEFDVFHYVRDAISLGMPRPKGLIVISHERFEEAGMELLPEWLAPLVPEVPVEFMSAENPYWVLPAP
jgi:putative NIF3 family GTP cyclohydrolase 1 type 2